MHHTHTLLSIMHHTLRHPHRYAQHTSAILYHKMALRLFEFAVAVAMLPAVGAQ
jgi:hypothetical protein